MPVLTATFLTRISRIALFWIAFALTRSFGATLSDALTKPTEHGGLDFGTVGSSAILAAVLIAFVGLAVVKEKRG